VFTRNKVNLDNQAAKKEVRTVTRGGRTLKVGVITIPSFYQDVAAQQAGDKNYRSTTRDVRRLVGELTSAGVDAIVDFPERWWAQHGAAVCADDRRSQLLCRLHLRRIAEHCGVVSGDAGGERRRGGDCRRA